jgi:hypothetical protein
VKYTDADEAGKAAVLAELQAELTVCTTEFENIMSDTTDALTAGGYSTAIIADYRAVFEAELEAGRKLAETL